jgi:hypothetical protein
MGGASCPIRGTLYDVAANSGACGIYCPWFNVDVDGTTRQGSFPVFFSMSLINLSTVLLQCTEYSKMMHNAGGQNL